VLVTVGKTKGRLQQPPTVDHNNFGFPWGILQFILLFTYLILLCQSSGRHETGTQYRRAIRLAFVDLERQGCGVTATKYI